MGVCITPWINMKVYCVSCIVVMLCVLLEYSDCRMMGGGGYKRKDQGYWRRRPWEVGYHGNRNRARRPWESAWRRERDMDEFIVKTERPHYYEDEEEPCTGLCLIKKMEALEAELKKKNKKKEKKETVRLYKQSKPKKNSAPCTGMCALMRQRTG